MAGPIPFKGVFPTKSSKKIIPKLQISDLKFDLLASDSGDLYSINLLSLYSK